MPKKPIRIEICASLGTGKTTLATALNALGIRAVYEEFEDNPYLNAFYLNPTAENAYEKDLWFIGAQSRQMESLVDKQGPFVMDYAQSLSMAYIDAGLNTPENKCKLKSEWQKTIDRVGYPDLLIVLDLPLDQQIARIKKRGRTGEADIPRTYIDSLNKAIQENLQRLPAQVKILHIDARRDFSDPAEISRLHKEILFVLKAGRGPKNPYLNFK